MVGPGRGLPEVRPTAQLDQPLGQGERRGRLEIVESAVLAPNRAIYLVRAADREILLGVTPTQITPLAEWDLDASAGLAVPTPFASVISAAGATKS